MFFSSRSKTLNSYSGGIFVGFNVGFLITPHLTSNHDHEPWENWFEIRYIPRSGSCKTKSYLFIKLNERSPSAICLIACRWPREKNRGSGLDSASHGSSTTRFASLRSHSLYEQVWLFEDVQEEHARITVCKELRIFTRRSKKDIKTHSKHIILKFEISLFIFNDTILISFFQFLCQRSSFPQT